MKKRNSHKGAIELSMTTVIVIILGVTLLSLGLLFVRNIFGKVDILTSQAFEEANAGIAKLRGNIEHELSVTSSEVTLKQGDTKVLGVLMANLGDREAKFQLKTSLPPQSARSAKFTCELADTEATASKSVSLSSAQDKDFKVIINDKAKTPLGTYGCVLSLYKDGAVGSEETIIIHIEK